MAIGCYGEDCCSEGTFYDQNSNTCIVQPINDTLVKKKDGVSVFALKNIKKLFDDCKKRCDNKKGFFGRSKKAKKKRKKCKKKCRNKNSARIDELENLESEEDMDDIEEEEITISQWQTLKNAWDNSITNLQEAPEEERLAEKNFLIYQDGEVGYNDVLLKRYQQIADQQVRNLLDKFRESKSAWETWLAKYSSQTTYTQRMNQLYKIKLDENEKFKKSLRNELDSTLTNDRKVAYEEQEFYYLHRLRTFTIYLYFGLLITFLIFGKFFKNKLYKNISVWVYIAIYIAFPFILPFIPIGIFYIIDQIKYLLNNKAPKNAYVDL